MSQTILLIDDSAILRRIAANVLGEQGARYDVVTATRTSEGFARACGTHPDLVLVDAQLAGTVKAELCQRFLAEPRTANVPVVLLMGRGVPAPSFNDLPENVVDALSKPFTPEQLLASVRAVLGASKGNTDFASIRAKMRGVTGQPSILVDRKAVTVAANHDTKRINRERIDSVNTAALAAGERANPIKADSTVCDRPPDSIRAEFQKVAAGKLSGILSLTLPDRSPLEVYFDAGKLIVVTTQDATAYSRGATGVLPAKVSPATLQAALDEQRASGIPFFLTLGARGLISKASAVDLLHRFGQQLFACLWEGRQQQIHRVFTQMDALPGFALRLEPRRESLDDWLLGTLRFLADTDVAAAAKHDGYVGTPVWTRDGSTILNSLKLTEHEREFARRVTGRLDLPGIARGMGISTETAYLILFRFRALEVMEYRPAPPAYVVTPRTSVRRVLPLRR